MNFTISLELGPTYEVTYLDGSRIQFQVIGGPNVEVNVIGKETATVSSILQNFKSITKIDE